MIHKDLFIRLSGFSETVEHIPDRYFRDYEELARYFEKCPHGYIHAVDHWYVEVVNFWYLEDENCEEIEYEVH